MTSVSIDNAIGTVQATGNRRVFPTDSTTYTLTASGPGGNTTASATVNVTVPPPPPPPPPPPAPAKTITERLSEEVKPIYFDYDKSDIRADAQSVLTQDASALKSILNDFPNASITLEGNCDARGSAEYNLGLGDRRAARPRSSWWGWGFPATVYAPSATARSTPTRTARTTPAGSRTATPSSRRPSRIVVRD